MADISNIRPMKAPSKATDLTKIVYPKLASIKIDGFRASVRNGVFLSSTLKPIVNRHAQEVFGLPELNGLDGEAVVGKANAPNAMQETSSGLTSRAGKPDVRFYVFDTICMEDLYFHRYTRTLRTVADAGHEKVIPIFQSIVRNEDEMLAYERYALDLGFEGIMLRDPLSKYKNGRATERENSLLKIKRFEDSECEILEVLQGFENRNEAKINALGLTERQTIKENKVAKPIVGGFLVRDIHTGVEFKCGTGVLTEEQLTTLWETHRGLRLGTPSPLTGRVFTYKYFPRGVKEKPRFPNFKSWRSHDDITDY